MHSIACNPLACFIVGLLFVGCSSQTVETVRAADDLQFRLVETDSAVVENDRLVLKMSEHDFDSEKMPGVKGYDFHSVVWQRNKTGEWTNHLTLAESDFQQDGRVLWITSIHSFDPTKATAVFKIGELGPADNTGTETATYSWREWDLRKKEEICVIESDSETTVYACPMMCEEQQLKTPGTCPICEMQLQPTLGPLPPSDN